MNRSHDDILTLFQALNESTTSNVDESKGDYVVGDVVKYDMLGEGAKLNDLHRTIGSVRVADRTIHQTMPATIIEAINGSVSRYSIKFKDGYVINGVTVNEIAGRWHTLNKIDEFRDVPTEHQFKIAKKTLKMSDVGARVAGGMSKAEARKFLADKKGWSKDRIAKMEESKMDEAVDPAAILYNIMDAAEDGKSEEVQAAIKKYGVQRFFADAQTEIDSLGPDKSDLYNTMLAMYHGLVEEAVVTESLIDIADTEMHEWFERDRAHVELRNSHTDDTIVEWWDEDVSQAVEDGFLNPRDYHGSAYEYAQEHKLLPGEHSKKEVAEAKKADKKKADKKADTVSDLEAKEVPQTQVPAEDPNIEAEDHGMEDRSKDDLEKDNKTKAPKEETMVRDVKKDELGNQPDNSVKEATVGKRVVLHWTKESQRSPENPSPPGTRSKATWMTDGTDKDVEDAKEYATKNKLKDWEVTIDEGITEVVSEGSNDPKKVELAKIRADVAAELDAAIMKMVEEGVLSDKMLVGVDTTEEKLLAISLGLKNIAGYMGDGPVVKPKPVSAPTEPSVTADTEDELDAPLPRDEEDEEALLPVDRDDRRLAASVEVEDGEHINEEDAEDQFTVIGRSIVDRKEADDLAKSDDGIVVADDKDNEKWMVITKGEAS